MAKQFGATDCLNPNDYDKPIKDVLLDINKWGIDHTFECIGNVNVMRQALESAHRGWGQSIIIGVAGAGQEISNASVPVGNRSCLERQRIWWCERSL